MHRAAYLILLLAAAFWGGNAVAGKLAVGHVSPMLLTALRWGGAAIVLLAFAGPRLAADWPVIRKHLLLMLIFLGNFLIFGLRPGVVQMAGFVLASAGVVLTASHGELGRLVQLDINFGDALMLIAVTVYAAYSIALRFRPVIHWLSLMAVLCAAAFLASIPFTIAEFAVGGIIMPDATGWGVVIYTALFPSVIAQAFYIKSVALIGANRAGMFINLVPIFGALMSVAVLSDDFRAYHGVALLMVLCGIGLSELGGQTAFKAGQRGPGRA
ncbi:MAG: carboxylate/amino acid/amine transporter [Rhizobiaceae bacterium]|nr:carboxylate/amino acid/amine transporter [Rhizobiaceae bacterium]